MKNIIIAVLVLMSMASCVEVLFDQPQPAGVKALKRIPKVLQGIYISDEKDTLLITASEFMGFENDEDSTSALSTNLVIKKYKKYYFISRKYDTNLWEVAFIKKAKNGNLKFKFIDGDDEEKMKMLQQYIDVEIKFNKKGEIDFYTINPTKKELYELVGKEIFSELEELKKLE